jgi:hypothetical protein
LGCVIIGVFALFQYTSVLHVFEGNLFVSHAVAQTVSFIYCVWTYLLIVSAHGNMILLMKVGKMLNSQVLVNEWAEFVNRFYRGGFKNYLYKSPKLKGLLTLFPSFLDPSHTKSFWVNIQHFWITIFYIILLKLPAIMLNNQFPFCYSKEKATSRYVSLPCAFFPYFSSLLYFTN